MRERVLALELLPDAVVVPQGEGQHLVELLSSQLGLGVQGNVPAKENIVLKSRIEAS